MISSQSRHSARMVRTKRSAKAFAFGARIGVWNHVDTFAAEDFVEGGAELAVAGSDRLSAASRMRSTRRACGGLACLRRITSSCRSTRISNSFDRSDRQRSTASSNRRHSIK